MFTGIIEATGNITAVSSSNGDVTLTILADELDLSDIAIGDSIAVNGVCLTATSIQGSEFTADVSKETLNVTTGLNQTQAVNLEKALTLQDRLGGHLVSGHVDGVGEVMQFEPVNDCWLLAIQSPPALSKYIARKGSICVNGVSLTVNTISKDVFTTNIIPHTIEKTTLDTLKHGDKVNLEIDLIARYVERMQQWEEERN